MESVSAQMVGWVTIPLGTFLYLTRCVCALSNRSQPEARHFAVRGLTLVAFGVPAITMLAVQLVAQPFFAAAIIDGFGHALRLRSYVPAAGSA
jgi:hypothetical protein